MRQPDPLSPPLAASVPLIDARGLRRSFPLPGGREIAAVSGVDIELAAGEIFGILGPNGAGKTTLLRMLAGIISPTGGHLRLLGKDLTRDRQEVRRAVGFVSGNTHLYGRLTPREHLTMFGQLFGLSRDQIARQSSELIARLDMESFAGRRVETLATGQIQRTSLARALIHAPRILILDEPTAGLDILGADAVLDLIRSFRGQGGGVILSTHQLTEAEGVCHRIALMLNGQLIMEGTLAELHARSSTGLLRDLFRQCAGPAASGSATTVAAPLLAHQPADAARNNEAPLGGARRSTAGRPRPEGPSA